MTKSLDRPIRPEELVSSAQVQAQAARSLALLLAIESTIERLTQNAAITRIVAREVESFNDRLRAQHSGADLDPEGCASELLLRSAELAERVHAREVARREAARRDHRLNGDDGVEEACSDYIAALAEYHTAVGELRETLLIAKARRSAVGNTLYDDADALVADILAGR